MVLLLTQLMEKITIGDFYFTNMEEKETCRKNWQLLLQKLDLAEHLIYFKLVQLTGCSRTEQFSLNS